MSKHNKKDSLKTPFIYKLHISNNYLKQLPEVNVLDVEYGSIKLWNNHLTSLDGIDWLCDLSIMGTQLYLQDNMVKLSKINEFFSKKCHECGPDCRS